MHHGDSAGTCVSFGDLQLELWIGGGPEQVEIRSGRQLIPTAVITVMNSVSVLRRAAAAQLKP